MRITTLAISFSAVIDQTFMSLAFSTPDFDYRIGPNGEEGNATFEVYTIMRTIGGGLIAIVLIYGALARVFESSELGLVNQGTSNRLFSKSVIFILVMFIFPPMWDGLSDAGDDLALWIANPLYTFDDDRPCPDAFYADVGGLWRDEYRKSPYILYANRFHTDGGAIGDPDRMEFLCKPELRVNYVFGQMLRNMEVNQLRDEFGMPVPNATGAINTDWIDNPSFDIMSGATGAITNLMLGLTKALVAIQVLIMTILLGVMTDLLVHMVIAALPVFLVLSVLPYCDRIFTKFIEAVPALLLIPMLSAIIVSVGAAGIAEAPTSAPGSPYADPDGWDQGAVDEASGGSFDHIYTWITALGVVFFAITLPTIMVPWIGTSLHMAQNVVSSAVQSSSLIAGSTATGMVTGAANARAGGGGIGSMIRGGLMGAGTAGVHAAGSAGMPLGGYGPKPGDMARGIESSKKAMESAAGSAEGTAARFDSMLEREGGKGVTRDGMRALSNAAQMGGGHGSLVPKWDNDLSNQQNIDRQHRAFVDKDGSAFEITRGITAGQAAGSMTGKALDNWANIVGETRAKLGNPELSTTGLDAMVNAQAKTFGEGTNVSKLKDEMVEEAMSIRGLDPDNADHQKAFMSDLAANDAAIKERGGVEYENGNWWGDQSNDGHPHTGSWEATRKFNNPEVPDAGRAAGSQAGKPSKPGQFSNS